MIRELIDMELEAVSGGKGFDLDFVSQYLNQTNSVDQFAVATGKNATAVNAVGSLSNSASQIAGIA
jgi:hypothetical protein